MSDIAINEMVVFIIRETGWTLEYVRQLPLADLVALVSELEYQKALENYRIASNFAMVIANWASAQSKTRRFNIENFIGPPPQRTIKEKEGDVWQLAQEKGIKIPQNGI